MNPQMTNLALCFIGILWSTAVNPMIIDLPSIHMDPNLHQLCWRQSEAISMKNRITINNTEFPINENNENDERKYCIAINSKDQQRVNITIKEGTIDKNVLLTVNFIQPLVPAARIIRKKITNNSLFFQLENTFGGLESNTNSSCQVLVIYKSPDSQPILKKFELVKQQTHNLPMNPKTSFKIYYTCNLPKMSSAFVFEQGSTFPKEERDQLKPKIIFPFRRVLFTKWNHESNVPKGYLVVIYEIFQNNIETCLKIFRLFTKSSETQESIESLIQLDCDRKVIVEDLGYYDKSNKTVFVVLDMVKPLKFGGRYKMFIAWKDILNEVKNNFIFFEPLPNLNSAIIDKEIASCYSFDFPILQNEISFNPNMIFNDIKQFSYKCILPVISYGTKQPIGNLSTQYNRTENACTINNIDCKENTIYPFIFFLINNGTSKFIEIISIPKQENKISKIKIKNFAANDKNSTFSVSWEIQPGHVTQSLFLIKIETEQSRNCSSLYILTCKTCNGEQKKISNESSSKIIKDLKDQCLFTKIMENYYEAVDKKILFYTNEMVPDIIFRARIFSFGLYEQADEIETNTAYIKESFGRKYGTIVISIVSLVSVFSVISGIYIWFRRLVTSGPKEVEKEDSNKYYGEDDV